MNIESERVSSDETGSEKSSQAKASSCASSGKCCTACGGAKIASLLRLDNAPVHQNLLYSSYEAALGCAVGAIELSACESCGFIFNSRFDDSLLDYSQDYENTQDKSRSFSAHMLGIAERLVEKHALSGKRILEIGCGKGGFLNLIVDRAGGVGKGFDPSYLNEFDRVPTLTFVKEFFPANEQWWQPDQIVCRHVLEHIAQPFQFAKMIRDAVPAGQFPYVYFEVPGFDWIAEKLAFWDIFYEHCNYFTAASLRRMLEKCGFEIDVIEKSFSGQYLSVDVTVSTGSKNDARPPLPDHDHSRLASNLRKRMHDLKSMIRQQRSEGKSIAVWGAAAKGSTFLNQLELTPDVVATVIDINPRKQGNYIAGTGQLICAPEFLQTNIRDVVYVMNPNYEDEIRRQLNAMQLFPTLVII